MRIIIKGVLLLSQQSKEVSIMSRSSSFTVSIWKYQMDKKNNKTRKQAY